MAGRDVQDINQAHIHLLGGHQVPEPNTFRTDTARLMHLAPRPGSGNGLIQALAATEDLIPDRSDRLPRHRDFLDVVDMIDIQRSETQNHDAGRRLPISAVIPVQGKQRIVVSFLQLPQRCTQVADLGLLSRIVGQIPDFKRIGLQVKQLFIGSFQ